MATDLMLQKGQASRGTSVPRPSRLRTVNLVASLTPGIIFTFGLLFLRTNRNFLWLNSPSKYPWQLWSMAISGILATSAGVGDWFYHQYKGGCIVCPLERKYETLALLGGGVPLFFFMCTASLSSKPTAFLIPVLVLVLFTTVLICYDEFVFHRRRCLPWETLLHRILVVGQATAWLAWMHWCYARS